MKVAKVFSPLRLALGLIVLPMLVVGLYLGLIAAKRYVTESGVSVRSATVTPTSSTTGISAGLTGTASPLSYQDTLYLLDYIHSDALLRQLEPKLKLRSHFETPKLDFIFKLWSGATQEDFLKYFRNRVELEFDDVSGLLTIRTQAFDAEMSEKLNKAILEAAERFVNDFSQRVAREQMAFSEQETQAAAQRLGEAKTNLVAFQTKNKLLDPVAQTNAASSLTASLQAQLSGQETQLKTLQSYLSKDSFQVQTLRDQVAATRAQLEIERSRTTAEQSNDRLNALTIDYQRLLVDASFAESTYQAALSALQAARLDAARKLKSVVIVAEPTKPESAIYPRYLFDLATLLVLCVIAYAIARLTVATIQEHQD
jgi:capsular polysaccharide transport system permease protein